MGEYAASCTVRAATQICQLGSGATGLARIILLSEGSDAGGGFDAPYREQHLDVRIRD